MTLGNGHLVGIFVDFLDTLDVGAIDLRVYPLCEHVQRHGHDIDVTRTLAVTEQGTLDAVGAGQQGQFGSGNAGTAVVVRMQRDDQIFAIVEVAAHPLIWSA